MPNLNPITKKYLPDYVELYPVDRYSEIPAEIIKECLENQSSQALEESLWDFWDSPTHHYMQEIKNKMYYDQLKDIFDEDEDEIIDWLYDNDQSEPLPTMARQTKIRSRLLLHSNHDCFSPETFSSEYIPHYRHQYEYKDALKEAIDLLAIDPASFKAADENNFCVGNWPNLNHRNNPIVDVKKFYECCVESYGYLNWGFFGISEGTTLLEAKFRLQDNLVLPKGTNCKWFGTFNGEGSLYECETIRDATIKELKENLNTPCPEYTHLNWEVDQKDGCSGGYSSEEVYGDVLNNELLIIR